MDLFRAAAKGDEAEVRLLVGSGSGCGRAGCRNEPAARGGIQREPGGEIIS
jgi:hypothetical protein